MDPLKKIPNRETLPQGPSLRQLAKEYAPEPLKETARLADLIGKSTSNIAFGEDSGLPLAESLIPGAELMSKISQGKRPGVLDVTDVIPGVGSLKTLGAMGPIVGTLSELKQGGRLGKTLRNIKKAKNPTIKFYHKTDVKNVPDIMSQGLLGRNENTNVHTFADKVPSMVWTGDRPDTQVLEKKTRHYPRSIGTIQIEMPKKEYMSRDQFIDNRWKDDGRGDFIKTDFNGIKAENDKRAPAYRHQRTTIFADDIPPQQLKDISEDIWKDHERKDYLQRLHVGVNGRILPHGNIPDNLPSNLVLEDALRNQPAPVRLNAIREGRAKKWKFGELPEGVKLPRSHTYSPKTQLEKSRIYDKFYPVPTEDHEHLMRQLYYEANPENKKKLLNYYRKDYLDDWLEDEDWFDFDDDAKKEFRDFLKRLESGKELRNYFPVTDWAD